MFDAHDKLNDLSSISRKAGKAAGRALNCALASNDSGKCGEMN
jgi:hypothetical protein